VALRWRTWRAGTARRTSIEAARTKSARGYRKFLARDAETGRIGTYQMQFTVPNLTVRRPKGCVLHTPVMLVA
jgi:hypothetical protein